MSLGHRRRKAVTRVAAVALVIGLGASATLGACGNATSHIYVGRQYDPKVQCLGEDISIDVVSGPEPTTPCTPLCITSTFDEAGALEVYVSSMCAPFPNYPWTLVPDAGDSPTCQAALVAWTNDTTCEDGGVIINLPDAGDSGSVGTKDAAAADASDAASQATDASDAGSASDASADATSE